MTPWGRGCPLGHTKNDDPNPPRPVGLLDESSF
jgi:hypothetical protein